MFVRQIGVSLVVCVPKDGVLLVICAPKMTFLIVQPIVATAFSPLGNSTYKFPIHKPTNDRMHVSPAGL